MVFKAWGFELSVHPEGKPYVWLGFGISATLLLIGGLSCSFLFAIILTASMIGFFRDPKRVTPKGDDVIVSPADGTVISIERVDALPGMDLGEIKMTRIMIFMSIFDVHINRSPIASRVLKTLHIPGKFGHAGHPKSTKYNEHNIVVLESESGSKIGVVQLAGRVARRIVCYPESGDFLATGERYGMIKFSSRVDIYLPETTKINVSVGQTMIGGETIIGQL